MYIERKEREELKILSKEVFGSTSRWEKLLRDGFTIPKGFNKSRKPNRKSKIPISQAYYPSVKEVREFLENQILKSRELAWED